MCSGNRGGPQVKHIAQGGVTEAVGPQVKHIPKDTGRAVGLLGDGGDARAHPPKRITKGSGKKDTKALLGDGGDARAHPPKRITMATLS